MTVISYSNHKLLLTLLKQRSFTRCLHRGQPTLGTPITTANVTTLFHGSRTLSHLPIRHHSSSSPQANAKPLFLHVLEQDYGDKIAVVDNLGQHSYKSLIEHSATLAPYLIANAARGETTSSDVDSSSQGILNGERITFLCPSNASYVVTQWAVWMAGGVAVPLCKDHPSAELEYVVEDSQSSLLLSTVLYRQKVQGIADKFDIKHLVLDENALCNTKSSNHDNNTLPELLQLNSTESLDLDVLEKQVLRDRWHEINWRNRNAMLVYTSGTTGRPKGAVTTFGGYQTQVCGLLYIVSFLVENGRDVHVHSTGQSRHCMVQKLRINYLCF